MHNKIGELKQLHIAKAAITRNQNTWRASTSGGAHSEICNSFLNGEGFVAGAEMRFPDVVHTVLPAQELDKHRKSK